MKITVSDDVAALNPDLADILKVGNGNPKPRTVRSVAPPTTGKSAEPTPSTRTKPVEFSIYGRPVTRNDFNDAAKTHYSMYAKLKKRVQAGVVDAMRANGINEGGSLYGGPVSVVVEAFYETGVAPDVDGIDLKPIFDAMEGWLYENDRQISEYRFKRSVKTGQHTHLKVRIERIRK